MTHQKSLLHRYLEGESGATAIEYGLIAALIGIALVVGAAALGGSINGMFGDVDGEISKAFESNSP